MKPAAMRRLLLAGRPAYVRAFGRLVAGERLSRRDRVLLAAARDGDAYPVPPQLDPTVRP